MSGHQRAERGPLRELRAAPRPRRRPRRRPRHEPGRRRSAARWATATTCPSGAPRPGHPPRRARRVAGAAAPASAVAAASSRSRRDHGRRRLGELDHEAGQGVGHRDGGVERLRRGVGETGQPLAGGAGSGAGLGRPPVGLPGHALVDVEAEQLDQQLLASAGRSCRNRANSPCGSTTQLVKWSNGRPSDAFDRGRHLAGRPGRARRPSAARLEPWPPSVRDPSVAVAAHHPGRHVPGAADSKVSRTLASVADRHHAGRRGARRRSGARCRRARSRSRRSRWTCPSRSGRRGRRSRRRRSRPSVGSRNDAEPVAASRRTGRISRRPGQLVVEQLGEEVDQALVVDALAGRGSRRTAPAGCDRRAPAAPVASPSGSARSTRTSSASGSSVRTSSASPARGGSVTTTRSQRVAQLIGQRGLARRACRGPCAVDERR